MGIEPGADVSQVNLIAGYGTWSNLVLVEFKMILMLVF